MYYYTLQDERDRSTDRAIVRRSGVNSFEVDTKHEIILYDSYF